MACANCNPRLQLSDHRRYAGHLGVNISSTDRLWEIYLDGHFVPNCLEVDAIMGEAVLARNAPCMTGCEDGFETWINRGSYRLVPPERRIPGRKARLWVYPVGTVGLTEGRECDEAPVHFPAAIGCGE